MHDLREQRILALAVLRENASQTCRPSRHVENRSTRFCLRLCHRSTVVSKCVARLARLRVGSGVKTVNQAGPSLLS